jgi:hypothetical protein
MFAIDGFSQNTGTGCFTHPTRTAKQKGMRQLAVFDGVLEGSGNMGLSHNRIKGLRTIFPG